MKTYALYDLAKDTGETANVFFDHSDMANITSPTPVPSHSKIQEGTPRHSAFHLIYELISNNDKEEGMEYPWE